MVALLRARTNTNTNTWDRYDISVRFRWKRKHRSAVSWKFRISCWLNQNVNPIGSYEYVTCSERRQIIKRYWQTIIDKWNVGKWKKCESATRHRDMGGGQLKQFWHTANMMRWATFRMLGIGIIRQELPSFGCVKPKWNRSSARLSTATSHLMYHLN